MEEMHYFKESQREEIPVPDFKDNITRKLLLQFLCDLCTWAQAMPVTSVGIKKMRIVQVPHQPALRAVPGGGVYFSIYMEIIVVDEVQPLMAAKYTAVSTPQRYPSLSAFCADSSR